MKCWSVTVFHLHYSCKFNIRSIAPVTSKLYSYKKKLYRKHDDNKKCNKGNILKQLVFFSISFTFFFQFFNFVFFIFNFYLRLNKRKFKYSQFIDQNRNETVYLFSIILFSINIVIVYSHRCCLIDQLILFYFFLC